MSGIMSQKLKYCSKCRIDMRHPDYGYLMLPDTNSKCCYCGSPIRSLNITIEDCFVIRHTSGDVGFLESMIRLHDEDIVSYEEKMSTFRANDPWWQEKHNSKPSPEEENRPKCPKCGSTHIQVVPRKWSFWRGLATNKTDRVCVNCNYKW